MLTIIEGKLTFMTQNVHSYQINAQTELAIRYNDISPLENHHAAVAFEILSQVMHDIVLKTMFHDNYRTYLLSLRAIIRFLENFMQRLYV